MRISSQANCFLFNFPISFIEPWLYEQFDKLMVKNFIPYDTVLDYVNATIKEVVIPGITYENQEQRLRRGKRVYWKDSKSVFDTFPGEFDITFRSVDSWTNYFILAQIMTEFYLNNHKHQIELFTLDILDKNGDLIYTILFREVFIKSTSEVRMGYQQYDVSERPFTVSFRYNFIDILWNLASDSETNQKSIFDIPIIFTEAPPIPKHLNSLPPS